MISQSDYDRVWNGVLDAMKQSGSLAPSSLDFWFRNFHIVYIDDASVVYSVEAELKRNTILARYLPLLTECTSAVVGGSPSIEIIVEEIPRQPLEGEGRVSSPLEIAQKNAAAEKNAEPAPDHTAREAHQSTGGERRLTYNGDYTFDNFIKGKSNEMALAAAIAVSSSPDIIYNPLFIYGPSGLGKTHLMRAVVNKMFERNPDLNAIYINGEDFTNQLVESIQRQTTAEFREKFRKADMLLIDDIQFIVGKEATQEEFFHTFNALYTEHKQIIVTSDRPPRDMVTLEDRIRSRFEQGLMVDIQPPDYELRLAILKDKAESCHLPLDDRVTEYVAEKLSSNIRQLEGAIKNLSAKYLLNGTEITLSDAIDVVKKMTEPAEPVGETSDRIIRAVGDHYGVTRADIVGLKRNKQISTARNLSMYLIRQTANLSLPKIGELFSNRDHTTVMSNISSIEKRLRTEAEFAAEVAQIRRELKQ